MTFSRSAGLLGVLGMTTLAVACQVSQDLGQDPLVDEDAGAGSNGGASGGSSGATSSSGGSSGATGSSGVASSSSGGSSGVTSSSGGSSGTTSSSSGGAACPTLDGYPTEPGLYGTWQGEDTLTPQLTHLHDPARDGRTSLAIVGDGMSAPAYAPIDDRWAVWSRKSMNDPINPGFTYGYNMFFWTDVRWTEQQPNYLQVGSSYPMHFTFTDAFHEGSGPGQSDTRCVEGFEYDPQSPQRYCIYPSATQGSCSMTVDSLVKIGIETCLLARFSCTGLVGAASGKTFGIADGRIVTGNTTPEQ